MKLQITVISPLGTFEGEADELEPGKWTAGQVKALGENIHRTNYLTIRQGSKAIYFPAEVIQKSIVILDMTE